MCIRHMHYTTTIFKDSPQMSTSNNQQVGHKAEHSLATSAHICQLKGKFVLFNDTSKAHGFSYHLLLDIKHMIIVTYLFTGNPLSPHRLLFPKNSKGSFTCTFPQTGQQAFVNGDEFG